jgi:hypothetical protein
MTCKMFSVLPGELESALINCLFLLREFGGRTRTRTLDPLIKSKFLRADTKRLQTTPADADPNISLADR